MLLLDEPTVGLDVVSAENSLNVIEQEFAAGRFVLVATRDLDDARRADFMVLLNGHVVAPGLPTWRRGRSVCARRTARRCSISVGRRSRSTTASATRTTNACITITLDGVDRLLETSGGAAFAAAVHVDDVVAWDEPLCFGDALEGSVEVSFGGGGERHVKHDAAGFADQVVMVLGEFFGELVVSVVATMDQPTHHTGVLHQ